MAMSILIEALSHRYHPGTALQVQALEDLTLTIQRDQWTSVVGHTGSGKSTLAQHLNAILRPTQGTVTVEGITVRSAKEQPKGDYREIRRRVGLIFQYPEQQLFEETVREEIAFAPRNWKVPEDQIPGLVERALQAVGLESSYLDRNPFGLSGGEKRRVAIASVLVLSPDYLVLDEPTAGLDGRGRQELLDLLRRLHRQGMGIVLITHDMEIAFSCSDRILVLDQGRKVLLGTPEETAQFLRDQGVSGLVLPPVMELALELRSRGRKVPLTGDPQKLLQALTKGR